MPLLGPNEYYRLYRADGSILGGTLNWKIAELWEGNRRVVEVRERSWDVPEGEA